MKMPVGHQVSRFINDASANDHLGRVLGDIAVDGFTGRGVGLLDLLNLLVKLLKLLLLLKEHMN